MSRVGKLYHEFKKDSKGNTIITYKITKDQMEKLIELDDTYSIRSDAHRVISDLVSKEFFERNKEDLLKMVTFDDLKSILLMTASKELMQKLTEMTSSRNY